MRLWLATLSLVSLALPGVVAADEAQSDTPLFSRHISAVFSRLGCNGGTCHGAVQGKNGFRLSLFSAKPEEDFEQVVRGSRGRRINPAAPDNSLLLLKASAQVPHGGGKVLDPQSREYAMLRAWIAAGAPPDDIDGSQVAGLRVTPQEQSASRGEQYALRVEATFADGSTEDVTHLARFESLDTSIASVDTSGEVTATGVGDTALIVRYRAEPVLATAIVPRAGEAPSSDAAEQTFVDRHILAKLARLNIPPAPVADDATFLRRAFLDVVGKLPAPDEARAFLADADPLKRSRLIDELLQRPGHAALWTMKFCDILGSSQFGVYADGLREEDDAPRFQAWVRAQLEENLPYDEFAARILLATSREGRSIEAWKDEVVAIYAGATGERNDIEVYRNRRTLDLYWQRADSQGVPGTLQVAHSFLGLRLECAQCHRHPHDVWQQDDLLSFANFMTRVRKTGFQGQNEKKYPDVAKHFQEMNEESKRLAEEAKKLKEQYKDYEKKVQEAQKSGDKARHEAAQKEFEEFRAKVGEMERRGKYLQEASKRLLHAEVRTEEGENAAWASVTSPLGTQESKQFRLLGETEPVEFAAGEDPREKLVAWMRQPDNPFFARAIVNRVWAHYFGRGIVDPPDHLSPLNPASHPELLDELAGKFVENEYDLRWLHRTILNSRTYQQSSQAGEANAVDGGNYAYFYYRRLPAEVLIDMIDQATGTTEDMDMKYYRWPEETRAVEIPYEPRNEYVKFMLHQFGRPQRSSSVQCDCERDNDPSVLQVLSLANHPRIWQKIADPSGRVAQIMKEKSSDEERIEEVFLAAVSRPPTEEERTACLEYVKQSESPETGLQGVLWSLMNTREFLLQH